MPRHDGKLLIVCLWWAFIACIVMITMMNVRLVGAEDDCAFGTWKVQRTPIGLLCIREGGT